MGTTKTATPEEVWAAIRQLTKAQERTEKERLLGENALRESQQKTEKSLRRLEKNLSIAHGNFNTKWGDFIAGLVSGDLLRLLNDRGIKVNHIQQKVTSYKHDGTKEHEYDLVAINGREAVVVEVKTTIGTDDVDTFIKKLKKFKSAIPKLGEGRAVYGGVAYLGVADKSPESYAVKKGLFVIQSPGGHSDVSAIINEKNFKPKTF